MIREDFTGRRFGHLMVVKITNRPHHVKWGTFYLCRCDCGNESTVFSGTLKRGLTKSCGRCRFKKAAIGRRMRRHGMTESPEYRTWSSMLTRCYNPKNKGFKHYGGRGITVCERWKTSFEAFLEDMGPRPSAKCSIDRIGTNGNYTPSNCRWATRTEQMRNKRVNRLLTYRGETKLLVE